MDIRMMVRTMLKSVPAPQAIKDGIDALAQVEYQRPTFAGQSDVREFEAMALAGNTLRLVGTRKGKRIIALIHAEDASLFTPELVEYLKGRPRG